MGEFTLKKLLLLPMAFVTGRQTTGGVKLVVAYNPQPPAHAGQLIASVFEFRLMPSAGTGRNTAAAAEYAPAPQPAAAGRL
jgi:hypothetical protein